MSLHPSLQTASAMKRHRSVLNRLERLKLLLAKGTWNTTMSPLGLPKIKHLKVTVKKEKAAAAPTEGAALAPVEGAVSPPAGGGTKPAKPAAPAKPDAAKSKKG